MLLCGEVLGQLYTLSVEVGNTNISHVNRIILGSVTYFFLLMFCQNKNRAMVHGMKKPRGLKVRCYAACNIDINKYLYSFPGSKSSEKNGDT